MTRIMYDSVDLDQIPADATAVIGYFDGRFNTWAAVCRRWRHANKLSLTVLGSRQAAGADCEPGNIDAAETAAWAADRLHAHPGERPVVYGSRDLVVAAGRRYGIPAILEELHARGIPRSKVRILSAHYGRGAHICSPVSCGAAFTADGTQYTDRALGRNLDESLLDDTFFPAAPKRAPAVKRVVRKVKPHPKVTAATAGGSLGVIIAAVLHAAHVHVTPAEASAIAAIASAIVGYLTPVGRRA